MGRSAYATTRCRCGADVSVAGLPLTSHKRMHVRKGEMEETFEGDRAHFRWLKTPEPAAFNEGSAKQTAATVNMLEYSKNPRPEWISLEARAEKVGKTWCVAVLSIKGVHTLENLDRSKWPEWLRVG